MNDNLVQELEAKCSRLLASNKPKIIVGKFSKIEEITEEQKKHFRSANKFGKYLWQVQPHQKDDGYKDMHLGVLLDEDLNYVHLVFASTEVLGYILDLNYEKEEETKD